MREHRTTKLKRSVGRAPVWAACARTEDSSQESPLATTNTKIKWNAMSPMAIQSS
jgi:hypothetical protein